MSPGRCMWAGAATHSTEMIPQAGQGPRPPESPRPAGDRGHQFPEAAPAPPAESGSELQVWLSHSERAV